MWTVILVWHPAVDGAMRRSNRSSPGRPLAHTSFSIRNRPPDWRGRLEVQGLDLALSVGARTPRVGDQASAAVAGAAITQLRPSALAR